MTIVKTKKMNKQPQYRVKAGAHIKGDIQAIGDEIRRIQAARGQWFSMQDIVDAAKDSDSPLHSNFTWDVKEASKKCWLQEARYLTRSIEIVCIKEPERTIRAFVHIQQETPNITRIALPSTNGDGRKWTSMDVVRKSPRLKRQLLEEALRDFVTLKQKYIVLKMEMGKIFEAIEELERELNEV